MSAHKEKQEIFNAYAKSLGFDDWHALLTSCIGSWFIVDEMNSHFMNACTLVQEFQQNRIAAKISNYVERFKDLDNHPPDLTDYCIMDNIITNPENRIN